MSGRREVNAASVCKRRRETVALGGWLNRVVRRRLKPTSESRFKTSHYESCDKSFTLSAEIFSVDREK